jgi:hypothetical protein
MLSAESTETKKNVPQFFSIERVEIAACLRNRSKGRRSKIAVIIKDKNYVLNQNVLPIYFGNPCLRQTFNRRIKYYPHPHPQFII